MLTGWRNDGLGRDQVELWVVGFESDQITVAGLAGNSEAACAIDSDERIFRALSANKDELFVIDAEHRVVSWFDLAQTALEEGDRRQQVDAAVRGAL